MRKLRVGILGCASVARRHAIPAFKSVETAELFAIASRDKDKARKWAEEFSIPIHGNYDEIINSDKVDAVYIALPTGLHEELAIKAANAGKHVICEKSLSDSYESVSRIVNACMKNRVVLFENFMSAYHPQHEKVKDLIKKYVGNVSLFSGNFGIPHVEKNNFRYNKKLGGGSLNDLGAYLVMMSKLILGEHPNAVTCSLKYAGKTGADIEGSALFEFPGGKNSLISFGLGRIYQNNYSVWGSNGLVRVNRAYSIPKNMKPEVILVKNENLQETTKNIELESSHQFMLSFKAFCEMVLERKQDVVKQTYRDILQQARVMQALRNSAQLNRRVEVSEIK